MATPVSKINGRPAAEVLASARKKRDEEMSAAEKQPTEDLRRASYRAQLDAIQGEPAPYAPNVNSSDDIAAERQKIEERFKQRTAAAAEKTSAPTDPNSKGQTVMREALKDYRTDQFVAAANAPLPISTEPLRQASILKPSRAETTPEPPAPTLAGPPAPPAAPAPDARNLNRLRARSVMQERREVDAANAGATNPADVKFESPFTAYLMTYRQKQKEDPRTFLRSAWLGGMEALKASNRNLTQTY